MEKRRLKEEAKGARPAAPLPMAEPALEAASADRTYRPFRVKKPQYFTAVSPRKDPDKARKVAKKKAKRQPT